MAIRTAETDGPAVANGPEPLHHYRRRRPGWRERILPRSVLGVSALILAFAVGAAFSGAVLYAYYDYRTDQSDERVESYVTGTDQRLAEASGTIAAETDAAVAEIRNELEPIRQLAASGETLTRLLEKVGPSVWFVATTDEEGQPSVGSGFVAFADAQRSYLLTSLETVRAATRQPGPGIEVRKGDDVLEGTLESWDGERDIALLSVPRGELPRLAWAEADEPVALGARVFAVTGLGSRGAAATQGVVADVTEASLQHDADVGVHFQGGPLVDSDGTVVGIASRTFAPLGFRPDGVWFAPPVTAACAQVVRCPADGELSVR